MGFPAHDWNPVLRRSCRLTPLTIHPDCFYDIGAVEILSEASQSTKRYCELSTPTCKLLLKGAGKSCRKGNLLLGPLWNDIKKLTAIWQDKNLGIFRTCFIHALGFRRKMRQMIFHKYRVKLRPGLNTAADINHRMIVNYHSPWIFGLHGCIIVSKAGGGLNRATGSSSSLLRCHNAQWELIGK